MVERSDGDNSCTGPGSKDATKGGESRKRSNEKTSNERVEDTQAGGEITRGSGVGEGRTTGHIADAPTQATDVTEGNRSATGPIIVGSGDKLDETKKFEETVRGGGAVTAKVEDTKAKPMDKLDLTALNNMERSQPEDEEDTYHASAWKFWRKKKRRKRIGKRKGTKRRGTTSRSRYTDRTRNNSVTSKPSKKEELNPFNPGGPRLGEDLSTIVTEAPTTKNGPGLDTIVLKNEQKHLDNEKKYRQLILEQRDDLARMREEINKKDEQLADAEAHRKRGLWQFLTGTYLAKTMSSIVVMAIIYAGFVAVIGSIISNVPFDDTLDLTDD